MSEAPEKPPFPTSEDSFVFKDINSCPAYIDKGWAGYDRGPALQIPRDLFGKPPYTCDVARVGDTVVFTPAKGATPAKFTIIPGEPDAESGTVKPVMATNASLEDLIKTGSMKVDDLGDDAKAQVADRSPELAKMIDGKEAQPENTGAVPIPSAS